MKIHPKPHAPQHPSSLGWQRNDEGPLLRTPPNYNPLPFAARMGIAASTRPTPILSSEQAKAAADEALRHSDPLLYANLLVVREAAAARQNRKGAR